jgi:drug/metabolite transporter (DMT)-like permease
MRRLYALLCLMVFFWALNFVIARIALREIPPLLAASLRAMLAGALLLPLYWWKGRQRDRERWTSREMPMLLLLGAVGVSGNQLFFLSGLDRTSTGHASVLIGLTPLMVLLISAAMGQELLTARRMLGMTIAIAGIGVLQLSRGGGGHATLLGDALILAAGGTFAAFTVIGKKLTTRHGGLTVNTFAYLGGGALLLPVVAWYWEQFSFSGVSAPAWLSLLYMAVFPSALCYLIFYYALTYIPASRVSSFGYLQPLMATALGVMFLGDVISSPLVAGGSLVLTGVYLTERS